MSEGVSIGENITGRKQVNDLEANESSTERSRRIGIRFDQTEPSATKTSCCVLDPQLARRSCTNITCAL